MLTENAKIEIERKLGIIEEKRKRVRNQITIIWFFAIILVVIVGTYGFTNYEKFNDEEGNGYKIILGICVGILLIAFFIAGSMNETVISDFKSTIMQPVLNILKPQLSYSISGRVSKIDFNKSGLFKCPDRYSGEDLFKGKHGKTQFIFSEIHAEEEHEHTDEDGDTYYTYTTIFRGVFMVADFNKHIKYTTKVKSSGGAGWFSGLERVKLENPEFERTFNVFSHDQIEARYILSPKLMERILDLKNKFNNNINISFIGNNIFIAISSYYDFFDPNLSDELSMKQVERIVKEIEHCIGIVDILDLNTRIWTKK